VAAKLEGGQLTPEFGWIRLADACRDAVQGLGAAAVRVRFDLPPDLPPILTDRRCLCQVLGNLLENALKYSAPDRPCLLGARAERDQLAIRVQDHGIGIAAPALDRIFERFYQVDLSDTRAVGGVGLGLTVVRELVLILGGTVEVTSQPGHGSCFTVKLPLRHPAASVDGR
jgi:signal transduction histidine kinase